MKPILHAISALLILTSVFSHAAETTLIATGSVWKYLDNGSDPGAAVRGWSYNDSAWPQGNAQFGYGDGDETTLVSFGADPNAKHITTYFRKQFVVVGVESIGGLLLRLLRDDGAIVHLNGSEVFRDNMPSGGIDYLTPASRSLDLPEEAQFLEVQLNPAFLQEGQNLIVVEVHQAGPTSSDLSFDLELLAEGGSPSVRVRRGPYLQNAHPAGLTIRWRTSVLTNSVVRWGTDSDHLNFAVTNALATIEHEVALTGLQPSTRYFYSIGASGTNLVRATNQFFVTPPPVGTRKPTRLWVIGDSGTGYQAQRDVRDAYAAYTGTNYTDVWLMLGDNAYCCGTDEQYQAAVFDMYPELLRETVLWPALGNHETYNSSIPLPHFEMFTLPTNALAGGVASGTENYFSFDYANIHFVCLDSMLSDRSPNGAMATWLRSDLENNTQDWIIAYWHHPPYTKGSHNSDTEIELIEMRQYILPILEQFGVDLVLAGHSHCYERSYFITGHYGHSSTLAPGNLVDAGSGRGAGAYRKDAGAQPGAVYAVAGSSGGQFGGGALNHPVMFYSVLTPGSMVLDVSSNRLEASFISLTGSVDDWFSIIKPEQGGPGQPTLVIRRDGSNVQLSWPLVPDFLLERKSPLEPGPWSVVTVPSETNGPLRFITLPAAEEKEFFRLRRDP